jgi:hypothetical protein
MIIPQVPLLAALLAAGINKPTAPDQKCARGFLPGFRADSYLYDVPAEGFINKTQSFFQSDWYVSAQE